MFTKLKTPAAKFFIFEINPLIFYLSVTSEFFEFPNALTLKDWLEAIHVVCCSYAKPYEKLMHVLA